MTQPRAALLSLALSGAMLACIHPAAQSGEPPISMSKAAAGSVAQASSDSVAAPRSNPESAAADTSSPTSVLPATSPSVSARSSDNDEILGLRVPEQGFRIATRGREIAPQSDVEYCEIAEVPGAPGELLASGHIEIANASGSHHLIVEKAEPGSPADRQVRALNVGDQVPCIGASQQFGADGMTRLAATQTLRGTYDFPSGVAQRLYGGQRLVFDYHYFNSGDRPLTAKSVLAVHVLSSTQPVTFVSPMAFTNMTIETPAKSEATFRAACRFKQDAMVMRLMRHTHSHGTDFSVWFDGGARDGELIWTSRDWEHETDFAFSTPIQVRAGEGFAFACGFRNEGSQPLRFGIGARDEMCILLADIWSPTVQRNIDPETCTMTWIDAQGIARDEDYPGRPKPDPSDVLSCTADTFGLGLLSSCVGCICDACAAPWARCMADGDCRPILECNSGCMGGGGTAACYQECESVISEHTSGVGMATQVGACIGAQCGSPCTATGESTTGDGMATPAP